MTDTIFADDQSAAVTPTEPVTPTSVVPPEIAELIGEGKKYKTVDDALKSVPHAQKHIQTLEEENARIKQELEKRKAAEELLDEIRSGITSPAQTTPVQTGIDPSQIEGTIEALLAKKEAQRTATQNITTVVSKFTETFGDKQKGEEAFYKLAQDTGLTPEYLNRLAATSPQAIFKLAGMDVTKPPVPGKPTSTVNTQALSQNNQQELSAKVSMVGASTKDVVTAWRNAGEKVKQDLGLK